MDERDLPKAPLSLLHIVNVSVDVGDGGGDRWTGRGLGNGVEEEVEERCGKFQIHNSTKFNHGSIHVTYATHVVHFQQPAFVLADGESNTGGSPHLTLTRPIAL